MYTFLYILKIKKVTKAKYTAIIKDKTDKKVFTDWIREIQYTNSQSKDPYVAMPIYNLLEYSGNYWKASGGLSLYCKNVPNNTLADSNLSKSKFEWTNCSISTSESPAFFSITNKKLYVPVVTLYKIIKNSYN